ncbi:MAG: glycosyltransferase family 9 protein [Chitinophagaceae bacterium]|nr:glycosyltransferase family 9 protein [Chitinophagaceae bacterium]
MKNVPRNIIISRTDSIGDVVLTLPMTALLKKQFPGCSIAFMGKHYTRPVIEACRHVDVFIDVEDFLKQPVSIEGAKPECIIHVFPVAAIARRARQLGIPLRIGTTSRLYHWFTCNKLLRLSRKNSDLHEAQLNLALLRPFNITGTYSLQQLGPLAGIERLQPLPEALRSILSKDKYNLILHPKSQGNGREWPLENYIELVHLLDLTRYAVFISGTAKERLLLQPLFDAVGDLVCDTTGKMNLSEFISFIHACDGMVASSTGPIHLAGALGKDAFGIYPPIRPLHPGRWAPIGPKAQVFVADAPCGQCKKNSRECHCMEKISAASIYNALEIQLKSDYENQRIYHH